MKKLNLFIFICSIFFSNCAHANEYKVTDLGAYDQPQDINSNDEIVGLSSTSISHSPAYPFYWSSTSGFKQLPSNGDTGQALGINDAGVIVGVTSSVSKPVYWLNSSAPISSFNYDNGGAAFKINDNNQTTGFIGAGSPHPNNAAFWPSLTSKATLIPPTGGSYSGGSDINESGVISGSTNYSTNTGLYHAMYWNGSIHDIGSLGDSGDSYSSAINDSNKIAGLSKNAAGYYHAFFWDGSTMTDLFPLSTKASVAADINNHDQVVGTDKDLEAFIWDSKNGVRSISTLVTNPNNWDFQSAYAINDRGDIVGFGTFNGVEHGFLLTVTPEPSSMLLFGIGGVALLLAQRKRRYVK